MSEWITGRLPTAEDGIADRVIVWDDDKGPMLWVYNHVSVGQPWMSIHCKPYVKPKRWTAHWNKLMNRWNIVGEDGSCVATLRIDVDGISTAQQIADIYNKVMP